MSRFHDILFEVSSETRFDIMKALRKGPLVMSEISGTLNISLTEASRHFSRLASINLIEKNVDGTFTLTTLGQAVLNHLKPLEFTSLHSDYFRTRDITRIPKGFQNRVHELSDATANYSKRVNVMRVSDNVSRIALEAKEYVLSIVDEGIMEFVLYVEPNDDIFKFFKEALFRGVKYRAIFPTSFDPEKIPKETMELYIDVANSGNLEYRMLDAPDVFLHMSEREASIVAFPDQTGLFDYLGFEASDSSSLNWCRDLFEYYWNRAKPMSFI